VRDAGASGMTRERIKSFSCGQRIESDKIHTPAVGDFQRNAVEGKCRRLATCLRGQTFNRSMPITKTREYVFNANWHQNYKNVRHLLGKPRTKDEICVIYLLPQKRDNLGLDFMCPKLKTYLCIMEFLEAHYEK
jgi:hypothetical protein